MRGMPERLSRPPLVRMLKIHQFLQAGSYPNCRQLAEEMEICRKTVQRDIDFMRDQMQMPIAYDELRHGFYYTEPVGNLPTLTISRSELVAVLVGQKAIEQYRGTPFEKPLASAFAKLAASVDERDGVAMHQLAEAFSFKPASLGQAELRAFGLAAQAVVEHRELAFQYAGLRDGALQPRRVQPYHLGCIADQWYLVGHDPDRQQIRTFALTRLRRPKLTRLSFERPADFDLNEFLAGSFSVFQARKVETVRLRLQPLAARLASERKWHSSQRLHPQPDGTSLLTLRVGIAPDLLNWILSWGAQAEVLAPEHLRETIAKELGRAAAAYQSLRPEPPTTAKRRAKQKNPPAAQRRQN